MPAPGTPKLFMPDVRNWSVFAHQVIKMLFPHRNPVFLSSAFALALILQAICPVNLYAAGSKQMVSVIPQPSQILQQDRLIEGGKFLQDMADAAAKLKSYSFTYQTTVFKGKKTINQEGSFWFKAPPRMIRVEMTGNYRNGAVAVLGKDGNCRGHLGGALKRFTVNLPANSDMLLGANGYPLVDSDFAGMSAAVKKFIQSGSRSKVSERPVTVEGQTQKVYLLEISNGDQLYKRAYIDPKTLLPVEWFDFQNGSLFAHTVWKDLNLDTNINDDMFKI